LTVSSASYTRVPDDEFDGLAEASLQILSEDDPW
jgi:hypothetical protein